MADGRRQNEALHLQAGKQDSLGKKKAGHLFSLRVVIPVLIVLLGAGMYFLPQTRLHRVASNQLYALLQDRQVQNLRQLVTADNSTGRRIMWQSASPMEAPQVVVRLAGRSEGELPYDAAQDFWSDDGSENYQYTVLLDNLKPDTEYEYAIADKDSRSAWHRLKTDGEDKPFKMLIFPDSQSADYSGWQRLAQGAWERNRDAVLVASMGDMVDNGEDSSQWRAWFRGLDNVISQSAFAPVMGNHECYDKSWQMRLPSAYLGYFQPPANGSGRFNRYYYSFDYGAVHFVVLCTSDYELEAF
ncbi:fibronectin type III domain-containing protein, partial [Anaerovibrio sp.]|uniref:fibronectin type III domain-containing protein n=1 Tax=Anaerovibrio sp. TaxID=1872532 RepID=UPI003F13507F